jgi:uncharacterized protein (TIGR02453 family)
MQKTLKFLKQLSSNNNREWFHEHKSDYEIAKEEVVQLLENIIASISKFDPIISGLEPKSCLFRINKDVRFSKDKSPYKLNFGASINPGGKKSMIPGYYIHIEPGKSFLAGGTYMPEPEFLNAIRQEIDYHTDEFKAILNQKKFKTLFGDLSNEDKLKTAPKGYDKNHPDVNLLQHKHFIVIYPLKDSQLLSEKLTKELSDVFKEMLPLNQFLRRCKA